MINYRDRWAVVTGASSGLGRGLASGLANRGMSLVLTGRKSTRLDETANQIRAASSSSHYDVAATDRGSQRDGYLIVH